MKDLHKVLECRSFDSAEGRPVLLNTAGEELCIPVLATEKSRKNRAQNILDGSEVDFI